MISADKPLRAVKPLDTVQPKYPSQSQVCLERMCVVPSILKSLSSLHSLLFTFPPAWLYVIYWPARSWLKTWTGGGGGGARQGAGI